MRGFAVGATDEPSNSLTDAHPDTLTDAPSNSLTDAHPDTLTDAHPDTLTDTHLDGLQRLWVLLADGRCG